MCKNCKHYSIDDDSCSCCTCPKFIIGYSEEIEEQDEVLVEGDEGWGFSPGPEFGCVHFKQMEAEVAALKERIKELDMMMVTTGEQLNTSLDDNQRLRKALESSNAAMWDGVLSGKGITKEYAQAVDREVKAALGEEGK